MVSLSAIHYRNDVAGSNENANLSLLLRNSKTLESPENWPPIRMSWRRQVTHWQLSYTAGVSKVIRLLDYPNDYVPVLTRHVPALKGQPATEGVDVVDKAALNARLARSHLVALLDRARIV
jgi:hypothetical protein